MNKKAVVLLSGGQDSTTSLYWALAQDFDVSAIGFNYGQSHVAELTQAAKIAKNAGVSYSVFNVNGLLAVSSLTDNVGEHNKQSRTNQDLPDSFTVGRNLLFLTIAASYCATIGANDIITGVCQTDYSGYPDCRRTTIDAMQTALSLGCGIGDVRIHTPLMYLTKAETWRLAKEIGCLDVILNDTLTDYSGNKTMNEWGMGALDNNASILRAKGYDEAKRNGWL
jgi:7-cyano-7-deazaguanine synthase